MKRSLWIVLVLLGVALLPQTVSAQLPAAVLMIGNDQYDFGPGEWTEQNGFYRLEFAVESNDYLASGLLTAKYDPFAAYGLSITNFGAGPLTVGLLFTAPMMPISDPCCVYGSMSGSLTDVAGDGTSLTPIAPDMDGDGISEIQHAFFDDLGVNAGIDVGEARVHGPATPGHSNVYGPFESGPKQGPMGTFDDLGMVVAFDLSGNDIATLNGFASIDPVPEPGALLLLGFGFAATAVAHLRRRRS